MSAKTVAEKLLIKPNTTVWVSDRARGELLAPLPEGTRIVSSPGKASTAVVFVEDAASLRKILGTDGDQLSGAEALWIAYPKGNRADINRDTLWPIVAEHGMRPIGQVAVDDVWSALRFRPLREGEAPFTGGR
ncbi:MAG TPA: hypothetical protein VFR44_07580 [Actinomycetota bacterium]|nr:hypothetical protein [Actinomycetota bacterium]